MARLYPYKSVARRMRYWGNVDRIKIKIDHSELE